MSFFLRRHPSASPKVKNYINKFEKIANEFQDSTLDFHKNTQNLDMKYKSLSHDLKHTLVSRSAMSYHHPREPLFNDKSRHANESMFITGHISHPSVPKKDVLPKIVQPKRCTPVSKVMPIRPVYGAYKYYDSVATREMKLGEEELMMEVRNYPQLEYEYRAFTDMKKVDPYFHIGGFPREVLLRSPDERVYTHVQSSENSNNPNNDNSDYMNDPSNYYIESDGNYHNQNESEYFENDIKENEFTSLEQNNPIERNQYENEIYNNGKPYNNHRAILTR